MICLSMHYSDSMQTELLDGASIDCAAALRCLEVSVWIAPMNCTCSRNTITAPEYKIKQGVVQHLNVFNNPPVHKKKATDHRAPTCKVEQGGGASPPGRGNAVHL